MKKQVYEIKIKVFLLQNINKCDVAKEIANYIDYGMSSDEKFLAMHKDKAYKPYTFNYLYPINIEEKEYKKGNIYSVQIRTIDFELAKFFNEKLVNMYTETIKGLTSEIKIIPRKPIEKIYSIVPVLCKNDKGYWRNCLSLEQFEKRLLDNIIKKYNYIYESKINEDFIFYNKLEFKNKKPIAINYKDVRLLGDKLELTIDSNPLSQELAYLSLAVGTLESNSRGFGFMGYRWIDERR